MTTVAQQIERNRTHSNSAYILLCELQLPDDTAVRLARNTENIAWPNTGSAGTVLAAEGESVSITADDTGSIEVAVSGEFAGEIALEVDDGAGDNWAEIASYTEPDGGTYLSIEGRTYRLIGRSITDGAPHCMLAPKGALWLAFDFLPDDIEESGSVETRGTTIHVGNARQVMFDYVRQLVAWRKLNGPELVMVRLCVVNTANLDDPVPVAEHVFVDDEVTCPPPMSKVDIKLGLENIWDRPVPRRSIHRDFCQWETEDECPYVQDCNHTLTACRTTYNNTINFGGFPTVERGAVYA